MNSCLVYPSANLVERCGLTTKGSPHGTTTEYDEGLAKAAGRLCWTVMMALASSVRAVGLAERAAFGLGWEGQSGERGRGGRESGDSERS